jgi:hypothetical protein
MHKSEFLSQLRSAVCRTAEEALAGTIWSAVGCPYIARWFQYYSRRDGAHIERAIRRYAPETAQATTARDYIPLICARVRRGISTWAETGEVTGVPEGMPTAMPGAGAAEGGGGILSRIASAGASLMGGIFFKSRDGGAREAGDLRAIQAQLGSGRLLDSGVKSRMESAFGVGFGHVRVHTDATAAGLSTNLNARAFTIGRDVAFGSSEYRPGTLVGDALIAHELAHVVQQEGAVSSVAPMEQGDTAYNALEEEADLSAAVGAIVSLRGGSERALAAIAQNTMPRLKSGLRLSRCRCEGKSTAELERAQRGIASRMGNPEANADKIIEIIDNLGSDADDVLITIGPIRDDSQANELAGSEAGQRILQRAIEALRNGNLYARSRADELEKILQARTSAPAPQVSPANQNAIARINAAINADPRKTQYLQASLPLRLPVTIYRPDLEMSGGVYYDPSMPSTAAEGVDVGITYGAIWTSPRYPTQFPLIYIRIGPLVLTHTDEHIRSVMWHEFQHYKRVLEYRKPDVEQSAESQALEQEYLAGTAGSVRPNMELEAISIQLRDYFDRLNDDEVKTTLRYFADNFVHARAQQGFKDAALQRITGTVSGDRKKQNRLLKLIQQLGPRRRRALAPLRNAIRANLAPRRRRP